MQKDVSESDIEDIKQSILQKITLTLGKDARHATRRDWYFASALALRDRIIHRRLHTERRTGRSARKKVYYLSLEFLVGRLFAEFLCNLNLQREFKLALEDLGVDLDEIRHLEPDGALGNGGLGRLAACYMESMASLSIPAYGYGIRYQHGLFRQVIRGGRQEEFPENWLSFGNPWEFQRPEDVYRVSFGGHVTEATDGKERPHVVWSPSETIEAVAYDTPIVGWRGGHVNILRLWSARAPDPLRLEQFNSGDHLGATSEQARAEAISKFLYPSDESLAGRELRLRQEYFFVSASLQDLVKRHIERHGEIQDLADHVSIQLNDTHPSVGVAELMRLLLDEHSLPWEQAWKVTLETFSYTNHTLMPEALEKWPLDLFQRLLPRHLQIIFEINERHLQNARALSSDLSFIASVSIVGDYSDRSLRMGHLAFVGSHTINGVSALHTDLMRTTVFKDLNELYPSRIVNKTNGISFRRWLLQANPGLAALLADVCGSALYDDFSLVERCVDYTNDASLLEQFAAVKRANKARLAKFLSEKLGVSVNPDAMFDVQIKRIHEYKRQLLNLLHVIARYQAILAEPDRDWTPRVKIFAGKAAASYSFAKLIIRLANDIAERVNSDPRMKGRLAVAFMPNYNVSLAEMIIPAADLSEQISTAGLEASGTGNMKLALNGALTVGTLDGANVEIREKVGAENFFLFGMTADEVREQRSRGLDATEAIARSISLRRAIDDLAEGAFSEDDKDRYAQVAYVLRHADAFMVSRDFASYENIQSEIDDAWRDAGAWNRSAVLNLGKMGWFSSDRSVSEYAKDIWNTPLQTGGAKNAG